jgi:hypothetical protein
VPPAGRRTTNVATLLALSLIAIGAVLFLAVSFFAVLRVVVGLILLPFKLLAWLLVLPFALAGGVLKFIVLGIVVPVVGAVLLALMLAAAAAVALPAAAVGLFVLVIWFVGRLISGPVAMAR